MARAIALALVLVWSGCARPAGRPGVERLGGATRGEEPLPAEAEELEAFCDGLKRSPESVTHFGLVGPETRRGGAWRRYATSEEVEQALRRHEIQEYAQVWQGGGTLVLLTEVGASGEFTHWQQYCYRSDGSLARLFSMLITHRASVEGGVMRTRVRYLGPSGEELATTEAAVNVDTGDDVVPGDYEDDEPRMYRRPEDLPFWAQTGSRGP